MTAQPNFDPEELAKFDQTEVVWWDPDGAMAPLHVINPVRTDYIATRCTLDGARVLDIGCGGGLLTEAMARAGATVVGADLSEQALAQARAHAADGGLTIDYRCTAAEELAATEPATYDVVTCMELLEHVPDPDALIAATAQLTRPGGAVFFSTINRTLAAFALAIVAAEHVLRLLPVGTHQYERFLRPSEVARSARTHNLDVCDVSGIHYQPMTKNAQLTTHTAVNYLMHTRRP